jgi:hypothetical protein
MLYDMALISLSLLGKRDGKTRDKKSFFIYIHFPFLYLFLHFFHNKKKGTQLLDEMSSSGSSFPLLVDDDATALL